MRSLVADIFHSLSRNSCMPASPSSLSFVPLTTRSGPPSRRSSTNRTLAGGEGGAERTDFDRRREQFVSDQTIRCRKRKPIRSPARRQAVALGAMSAAVLYGARRPNGENEKLVHEAISSATISPASAARSCSAKVL